MLCRKDKTYYDRFLQRLTVHPDYTLPVEVRRFQKCMLQLNSEEMRIVNTKRVRSLFKTKLGLPARVVDRLTKGVMDDGDIIDCSCTRNRSCAPPEVLEEINGLASACNQPKGVFCMNVHPTVQPPDTFDVIIPNKEEKSDNEKGEKKAQSKDDIQHLNSNTGKMMREKSMNGDRSFEGEGDEDIKLAERRRKGAKASPTSGSPINLRPRRLSFSTSTPNKEESKTRNETAAEGEQERKQEREQERKQEREQECETDICRDFGTPTSPPLPLAFEEVGEVKEAEDGHEGCYEQVNVNAARIGGKGGNITPAHSDDSYYTSLSDYMDESLSEDSTTVGVRDNVKKRVDQGRAKAVLVTKKDKAESIDGLMEDFLDVAKNKTTFCSVTIEDDEDVLSECEFEAKLIETLKTHPHPLSCQVNVRKNKVLRSLTCYHNPLTPSKPLGALIDAWGCIQPDLPAIKHVHLYK